MTENDKMLREQALACLDWQVQMGADEAIADAPIDRFALSERSSSQAQAANPAGQGAPPAAAASEILARTQPNVATPAAGRLASSQDIEQDARGLATRAQSLHDIARALETFDACPLKRTATNLCYYDGNPQARVMFIGEAPGRDEDLQGKPFVGRSGKLLDSMLAAIGLDRKSDDPRTAVFITNVIYWRPPGNRTPTDSETLMCLPFVERTIELQQPEVIVCLGATPMQRLTGRTGGILKSRGRWMQLEIAGRSIPLMATLHPAYLLRQPVQKRLAWRDFLEIRKRLDSGPS